MKSVSTRGRAATCGSLLDAWFGKWKLPVMVKHPLGSLDFGNTLHSRIRRRYATLSQARIFISDIFNTGDVLRLQTGFTVLRHHGSKDSEAFRTIIKI